MTATLGIVEACGPIEGHTQLLQDEVLAKLPAVEQPCGRRGADWKAGVFEMRGTALLAHGKSNSVRPASPSELPELDSISTDNGSMKTTVDIPDHELRDAMRFTKAKTKREAVVWVLEDFNRRRRMAELVKYAGTFSDEFPSNDEIEAVDARRARKLDARPRR